MNNDKELLQLLTSIVENASQCFNKGHDLGIKKCIIYLQKCSKLDFKDSSPNEVILKLSKNIMEIENE